MIGKAGYDNLSWVEALAKFKKPTTIEDQISTGSELEAAENVLKTTANIVFEAPTKADTGKEAMAKESKQIQAREVIAREQSAIDTIKTKLASVGIDPVQLGVCKKEDWEVAGTTSSVQIEKIAKEAALAYDKKMAYDWQEASKTPQQFSMKFDENTTRAGKIMSSKAVTEDITPQRTLTPKNTNSIFDPFKLDKYAKEKDREMETVQGRQDERVGERLAENEEHVKQTTLNDADIMRTGMIQKAGGQDSSVFQHRVPKNQVSILDTMGKGTSGLKDLFEKKIEDNGEKIRKANEERKNQIHRPEAQKENAWEEVKKPTSTADIARRLTSLWLPESK